MITIQFDFSRLINHAIFLRVKNYIAKVTKIFEIVVLQLAEGCLIVLRSVLN